jgi:LacI family transcriptional regulator
MSNGRITIKDLARRLGISKSTVSRALRDHPNVKPETRQAVLALAQQLDYSPDPVALSLLQQHSFSLGMVIPRISFPYFSLLLSGAQDIARQAGYQLLFMQSDEAYQLEKTALRTLVANRVAGVLVSLAQETEDYAHLHRLQQQGTPLVLFDRVMNEGNLPRVVMNNYHAAYQATVHLYEMGCRRIAHIGGPQALLVSHERANGYRAALNDLGLGFNPAWLVPAGFRLESGRQGLAQLWENDAVPDGLLCVSDSAAIGAMQALESRGVAVPQEVALVGFNDEPLASLVRPALTTMALPMYEMGQQATRSLLHLISYPEEPLPQQKLVLKSQLVVRDSSRRGENRELGE